MPTIHDYKIDGDQLIDSLIKVGGFPSKDKSVQALLNISDEVLFKYYQTAKTFVDQKEWFEARDAFVFLTFVNPQMHDFWICLGYAQQSEGRFQEAIVAYTMAEVTDATDPIAFANAFQCGLAIGETDYAHYMLDRALECCGDSADYDELKQKLLKYHKS